MLGTSASFSHPRDAAIGVVHRDGSHWRYDHATVARRDPRVVAWCSAATGRAHAGPAAPAGLAPSRVARIAPQAAAVLPRATRFNQHVFATRRAHNQQ